MLRSREAQTGVPRTSCMKDVLYITLLFNEHFCLRNTHLPSANGLGRWEYKTALESVPDHLRTRIVNGGSQSGLDKTG